MRRIFDYDNSSFINDLKRMGFHETLNARADFAQTSLSLASALNLGYLQNLLPDSHLIGQDRAASIRLIHHSLWTRLLDERGYTHRALEPGYRSTALKTSSESIQLTSAATNLYERLLIENSLLALVGSVPSSPAAFAHPGYGLHRARTGFALDFLGRPSGGKGGPLWTFTHILAPHPPTPSAIQSNQTTLMFLPDGSAYPGEMGAYRRQYVEQLGYVNRELLTAHSEFVEEKGGEAAIVIQADYGPGSQLDWDSYEAANHPERLGILMGYRLPGAIGILGGGIRSPVNLYRALSNDLLHTELPLLVNRSYYYNVGPTVCFSEGARRVSIRAGKRVRPSVGTSIRRPLNTPMVPVAGDPPSGTRPVAETIRRLAFDA